MRLVALLVVSLVTACAQHPPSAGAGEGRPSVASPLDWPLQGRLSSGFGPRRSGHHAGIDLRVPSGTPIRSADAGTVTFSDRQRGYGRVVIVRHASGLETRYAHNRKNLVRKGQRVARGEVIAEAGSSGNASAPHLHFEVRVGGTARDPLRYLPTVVTRVPRR